MQIYYSNIKTKGEQSITQNERREMRNAIVDYGALQPSPVQSSSDNEGGPAAGILGKLKLQYIAPTSSGPIPSAAMVQTPVTLPSLQNSPMQNQHSPMPNQHHSPATHHTSSTHNHTSPETQNPTSPAKYHGASPSPTMDSPHMQQNERNLGQQNQFQTVELDFLSPGFDMFEIDFNINDGDLESAIADAAQGFWTDFPGEVEVL
jgi:hypothetical protein